MSKGRSLLLRFVLVFVGCTACFTRDYASDVIDMSAEVLEDKIRGGLLASLEQYPKLLDVLFYKSPGPAGDGLRKAALAAGLKKPSR